MDRDRTYTSRIVSGNATASDSRPGGSGRPPRGKAGGKAPVLVALTVLLVVTIAGTSFLVLQQLHAQEPNKTSSNTPATGLGAATKPDTDPAVTPTPDLRLPASNGWTTITAAKFGDVEFASSDPRKGYECGTLAASSQHVFGLTTDSGQTWTIGDSPASYTTCAIQVSPSNPLDVTLTSVNAPGEGNSAFVEAHYSTNGGQSWQAAPIPQNTTGPASLLWSGSYLYLILPNLLAVSSNGGAFTPIALSSILPGAQQVTLTSGVAAADRLYLNVQTTTCQSPCETLLASANGGASWTKIPNDGDIQLDYVRGNALFGTVRSGPFLVSFLSSSDSGANWGVLPFPVLPAGQGFSYYLVAPDQSVYTADGRTVYALRKSGSWIAIPFAAGDQDSIQVTAISVDTDLQPLRIWGHDDGAHPGVYWHSLA